MILSESSFFYGFEIRSGSNANYALDFKEGTAATRLAEIPVGIYSASDFARVVADALTQTGTQIYTVTFNRVNRRFTIAAQSNFTLLANTGTSSAMGPWELLGLPTTGDYSGVSVSGFRSGGDLYEPQFKLQDWVDPDDQVEAIDASIAETTSGIIEVVKFGDKRFISLNITLATNQPQTIDSVIRNNPTGIQDLRRFMKFLINKGPIEFMPDRSNPNAFYTLKLESTPENNKGTGYRLKELYAKNLPFYYETGILKFRVVET